MRQPPRIDVDDAAGGNVVPVAMMSRAEAVEFLGTGARTGRLATATSSGDPHVVPVWFVVDGDDLVFTTSATSVKGRNLRENPRAALTVDVDEFPYQFVSVRGPVTTDVDDPDLLDWSMTLARRYVPADRADEFGRRNAVPGEMVCRLRMDRITGMRDVAG